MPEIRKWEGETQVSVAVVPDITSTEHTTINGNPLNVDVDGINALRNRQRLVVECKEIGGRRVLGLTQEGLGDSADPKRGDGLLPRVTVLLLDRPIRVSYRDNVRVTPTMAGPNDGYYETKRTYLNPRWLPSHEGG